MGKVKKVRQKLHQKAVRFPDEKQTIDPMKANESSLPSIFPTSCLFNDKETTKDVSTTKNTTASKKDKRKERHERFLKKLHGTRAVEESIKRAEKRAQTVIVGDMEPLLSALPTIALPKTSKENSNTNQENSKKNKLSRATRQKQQNADIEHFKQVLKHPSYQSNPISAISEHLKIAVQREADPKT
ncbi:ribosome biogenesis protein slx9-like [Actinia tenebrosa]|uniref:Ribosome biogenesis protein slx9-like n=1 Tax=Actinia tenebrosa TaxID=6105 RepID=A0A6P8HRQ4_ACTTE|nr:ribosome biogenesis protein slx9-like [Actinia tenebrosa]